MYAYTNIDPNSFREAENHDGLEYDHCDSGTEVDYDSRETIKFIDANEEECDETRIELVESDKPRTTSTATP